MTVRDRLFALEAFGIKLGLENIRALLARLQHPERRFASVHIAGTNGKGSVSAMVARALSAAGHRTGLYTSPHLAGIEERIAIDGSAIDAATFDAVSARVLGAVDALLASGALGVTPTFFEVTTAVALQSFADAGVEAAVLEVGLGGRWDATNVITPLVGAITSIGFDHERHLGSTLASIAFEKAGIAKTGVPLVVGAVPSEAHAVIAGCAADARAPLVDAHDRASLGVRMAAGRATVDIRTPAARYGPAALSLLGRHQAENALVAVRVLEIAAAQGLRIAEADIVAGLTTARWPARLEWLSTAEGRVLIDAAHNPAGAEALAAYLRDAGQAPCPIVLAVMQDKDLRGIVTALAPVASRFVATEVPMARARRAVALADELTALASHVAVIAETSPDHAVRLALLDRHVAAAAGSIYFVGPLRARLVASGAEPI